MITRATRAVQNAWDEYFSGIYYPVVCLVFLWVVIFNWSQGRKLANDWEPWTITEWLVNYAPGFLRRGLTGELLIFVNSRTGWPLNTLALGTFEVLCATFLVVLAVMLSRRRLTFWYFVLCLSPGFVLFTFYEPAAVGRKEFLIFATFALWTSFSAGHGRGVRFHLAFGVLAFLLTLMHEMFFFFTPYFVLLAYHRSREERAGGVGGTWPRSLLVPGASAIAVLLVLWFSASVNDPLVCDRLRFLGAPARACEGVLDYRSPSFREAWTDFVGRANSEQWLPVVRIFPFVLIPFYLFMTTAAKRVASPLVLTAVAALVILFSSPLFILAIDWGRWISIHIVLLTIACAAFLPARGTPRPKAAFSVTTAVSLAAGLVVLASMFGWSFKYCCRSDYLKPMNPVEAVIDAWQDLEL